MVDQLVETWQAPPLTARAFVEHREVLPLLDGLDETSPNVRAACAESTSQYYRTHGLDPLAVGSRTAEYFAQRVRLDLQKAVITQPLTPD
jgi:hypothetical protein